MKNLKNLDIIKNKNEKTKNFKKNEINIINEKIKKIEKIFQTNFKEIDDSIFKK
ncbi:hypothetical protein [Buchnera aphidicola]|uniref:hypothetical protein n=1 Tax=Buchnera aphidicola TaxID=9 RepID=UPI0031B70AB6